MTRSKRPLPWSWSVPSSAQDHPLPEASWQLDAQPRLELGAIDSAPEQQFHQIAGATRLDDGRIIVADRGSSELRVFGPDGEFVARHGGPGGAPGEFRVITDLVHAADSLFVYDQGLRRMSVFSPDDGFVRAFSSDRLTFRPAGRNADGSFAFGGVDLEPTGGMPEEGRTRDSHLYVRLDPQGEPADTLFQFAGPERLVEMVTAGERVRPQLTQVVFAANPRLIAGGRHIAFTSG